MRYTFVSLLVLLTLLCGCGSPPTKELLPSSTPYGDQNEGIAFTPVKSNGNEHTSYITNEAVFEEHTKYTRLEERLNDLVFSTGLFDISIDSTVLHVDATQIPDLVVKPRKVGEMTAIQAINEGWILDCFQDNYFVRIDLYDPHLEYVWDVSPDNRWGSSDEYVGNLSEENTFKKAQELADIYGFEEVSVVESRAYGKLGNPESSFRMVIMQSFQDGIGITPEVYLTNELIELNGERIVFMMNDAGCIRISMYALEIDDRIENDTSIITLETALECLKSQIDNVSDAPESNYEIGRIALEYVPVTKADDMKQVLIPAWTFTSNINYETNKNLVAWINARTGEMIK